MRRTRISKKNTNTTTKETRRCQTKRRRKKELYSISNAMRIILARQIILVYVYKEQSFVRIEVENSQVVKVGGNRIHKNHSTSVLFPSLSKLAFSTFSFDTFKNVYVLKKYILLIFLNNFQQSLLHSSFPGFNSNVVLAIKTKQ